MSGRLFVVLSLVCVLVLLSGCVDLLDEILGSAENIACENIDPGTINEEWDKDHCFKDAALRKGDPDLCAKIEFNPPQTKCYMELAEKLGQADICLRMETKHVQAYTQAQCLYQVALKNKDSAVCDMIGDGSYTDFIGKEYSLSECYKAVGVDQASIQEIYDGSEDAFVFCYDIVYSKLHMKPPDKRTGNPDIVEEKKKIYEDLKSRGYGEVQQGYVAEESEEVSFMNLAEGDVIMFGFDSAPNPENAPHYAIVEDGKIWQIVHWTEGGALDGPRDPEFFFNERTLTNPFTGKTSTSPRVYHYYRIYRKE